MYAQIRGFFAEHGVIEVETPLLSHAAGTDLQLEPFMLADGGTWWWLSTSPEFHMKRLLAAGSGSIFQLCKAFRRGESGRWHNPEFTLLEWYRIGFDLGALMAEAIALLGRLLPSEVLRAPAERRSYQEVFMAYACADPLTATVAEFDRCAQARGIPEAMALCGTRRADWLDLLFSHLVQPHLGVNRITCVYGFPACQSALARLSPNDPRTAERVEIFVNGVELANGYHELTDVIEQQGRFQLERAERAARGLPIAAVDQRFLDALTIGLPNCCGMAMGVDRVLMLAVGATSMHEVLAFPVDRA